MIGEVVVFLGLVAVIAAVGLAIGILVAPRLERLTERDDQEEPGGDDAASD